MKKLALLSLLVLSGCAVGPNYQSPPIAVPESWSTRVDKMQVDINVWPDPEWWQIFGSCELNAIIKEGMAYNYDLIAALSRVYEARATAKIINANFYPALDFAASKTQSRGLTAIGSIFSKNYQLEFDAIYEVDLWGKLYREREAAEANVLGSLYDRETIRLTVVSTIASTYFLILSLNDRLDIAKRTVQAYEETLRVASIRFRLGYSSQLEVLQQETVLKNVQATIPDLEQARQIAINALLVLIGKYPTGIYLEDAGLAALKLPPALPEGMSGDLLERRPDICKLEADLAAANALIGVAYGNFFPSIVLTGDRGSTSSKLHTLLHFPNRFYDIALSLTQPIFEGFKLEGGLERAQANYAETLANYYKGVLAAYSEVETSLIKVEKFTEQQEILEQSVKAAYESYHLAELNYRQGHVDFLYVLDAQRTYLGTQDTLVQSTFNRFNSIVSLYKALGGGWCWNEGKLQRGP